MKYTSGHSAMAQLSLAAMVTLWGVACGSGDQKKCQGAERCDCYGNGTCDDGLVCLSNACVSLVSGGGGTLTVPGTGGSPGTGGVTPVPGTGGTTVTVPPASPNCTDVSSVIYSLTDKGSATLVAVAGSDKQYVAQSNWWNVFNKQTVAGNGLSFTVGNPAGAASSDDNPMGYPSLFIGSYAGRTSKGSNLPKQVSALTKVNTVFSTNALSMGTSNYNAAYDVWFTAASAPLASTQYNPGAGGAYLMVWLFNPAGRQPRGAKTYSRHTVSGLPGTWDVWIDNTDPLCISYVSTSVLEKLDFDLNNFIQDSVSNRYGITSSMYLSIVFAGFEIWGGGNGLQAKAFCANVL
jgi:cellulose 1,4-beta-cellobiosidase